MINDFFTKVTLEKVRVASQKAATACESRAKYGFREGDIRDELIYELRSYVHAAGRQMISVHRKWPATWWDHLKERWFPLWAQNRWPIKYERIDIEEHKFAAVCPHIQDDPQSTHLEFMYQENQTFLVQECNGMPEEGRLQ